MKEMKTIKFPGDAEPREIVDAKARRRLDTLESNLEYVTPKMFNAVGDGVTDDTEAVQNALDYAIENNLALYITAGQYRITNTLTLNDTINIYGDGQTNQHNYKSTLLFDVGDEDIPMLTEAEGVTQVGRCTFTNVSFLRVRTTADGRDDNDFCYGKTGTCIGFNSNETSFIRCSFTGFNVVVVRAGITDFIDCDFTYCNSILANEKLCNSVSFYGADIYACGVLLKANGHLSTVNFTNCWIEDFVELVETKGVSILGLNFTGCTLTNKANGLDMLVYTDTPSFAREFINFTDCLLYIKGQICTSMPGSIEFGLTFERCTVYYGGTGETIKIYGNSKFVDMDGANTTVLGTNSGFNTRSCTANAPITLSEAALTGAMQLGKPNGAYVETRDSNLNRMLMLPVYYEFVSNPANSRYFVFNTKAVSEGDWVLKFVYTNSVGTTIEKIIVEL